jgi:integrase/recombinase XerD
MLIISVLKYISTCEICNNINNKQQIFSFICMQLIVHPYHFEGQTRIGVQMAGYDPALPVLMKQVPGARWSPVHRHWHLPRTTEVWQAFKAVFSDHEIIKDVIAGDAQPVVVANDQNQSISTSDVIEIKETPDKPQYLSLILPPALIELWLPTVKNIHGRRWDSEKYVWLIPFTLLTLRFLDSYFSPDLLKKSFSIPDDIPEKLDEPPKPPRKPVNEPPPARYAAAAQALDQAIMLKRYSWRTQKAYRNNFLAFIRYYDDIKPSQITRKQILDYLAYLVRDKQVSVSHQSQVLSAIKMFYAEVVYQPEKIEHLYTPKKPQKLPKVMIEEEVVALLNAVDNLKHRCILMLVYSGGLRLGEVINLRLKELQPTQNRIFIRNGKGGKDRCTILSDRAWKHLQTYIQIYKPVDWVFEGATGGQYSERSVQEIFTQAKLCSGINPGATVHTLRHSFATHLLEKGVDLRYIQELLGHESSKTTEIYTHITKKGWEKIRSPLDDLQL